MAVIETPPTDSTDLYGAGGYFCKIRFQKYTRPKPFDTSKNTNVFTAYLPLPNELKDNTSTDIQTTSLGAVADLFNGDITSGAGALALRSGAQVIGNLGAAVGNGLSKAFNGPVGGIVGGTNGVLSQFDPASIMTVLEQNIGTAPNPNMTAVFNGPELRSHSFSWTFQPSSEEEVVKIKKIVHLFKKLSLPLTTINKQAALLEYPHMCMINFYPWDDGTSADDYGWSDNSIIKIKKCFMSDVSVNYSPAGVPGFFEGSQYPFAISLNVELKEMEYMLSNDYGGDSPYQGAGDVLSKAGQAFKGALNAAHTMANEAGTKTTELFGSIL